MTQFGATLLGGGLTILGGILGTLVLVWLEERGERSRRRERHATALRIVELEMRGIGAAFIIRATGADFRPISTAGYNAVAVDLYCLLPQELASDVAFVYQLAHDPGSPAGAKLVADRIVTVLKALRAYGRKELGLKFEVAEEERAS